MVAFHISGGMFCLCLHSGRTDRISRIETKGGTSDTLIAGPLRACPGCRMCFFCCDGHWSAVRNRHTAIPSEDGHDGLTQCQLNQEIREDIRLANIITGAPTPTGQFQWAPERVKSAWSSLKHLTWQSDFDPEVRSAFQLPSDANVGPYVRAASDGLSMPMTILWALENLNEDQTWTQRKILNIHVRR